MTSNNHFISLCSLDAVANGDIGMGYLPDGRRVAVYLVEGNVYATDDRCTHGNSSLT